MPRAGSNSHRAWAFTLHDFTEEQETNLRNVNCRYMVVGRETTQEGRPHLQGYVYFADQVSMAACKLRLNVGPTVHIENAIGTADQNRTYCSKEGEFWEKGVMPLTPVEKGQKEKVRWDFTRAAAEAGQMDRIDSKTAVIYCRQLEYIHTRAQARRILANSDHKPLWLWGPTGTGKSHLMREVFGANPHELFIKISGTKFWDGYDGQKYVGFEEVNQMAGTVEMASNFKIWLDKYQFPVEIKGGSRSIRPARIIITSNYHPRDIWLRQEDLDPILRRLELVHFEDRYNQPLLTPFLVPDVEIIEGAPPTLPPAPAAQAAALLRQNGEFTDEEIEELLAEAAEIHRERALLEQSQEEAEFFGYDSDGSQAAEDWRQEEDIRMADRNGFLTSDESDGEDLY